MHVRAFGPLTVVEGNRTVQISSNREASLLAILIVEIGVVVGKDRLIDELWADGRGTSGSLRVTVNRLRRRCASLSVDLPLSTHGRGYRLDLEPDAIDLEQFDRLAQVTLDTGGGTTDKPSLRAAHQKAEALWQGEPFADLDGPTVRRARRLLIDRRHELARAVGADLIRSGQLNEARSVLENLVEQDPYQEHAWGLLATALYRQGRQGDALQLLAKLRGQLRDELGIHPSSLVQGIEMAILNQHDPIMVGAELLGWPSPTSGSGSDPGQSGGPPTDRAEAEARLRAARTLLRAGALDQAVGLVEEVEAMARSGDDDGLTAEALLLRGQLSLAGPGDPHVPLNQARQLARDRQDGDLLARIALVRFGAGVPPSDQASILDLIEPVDLLPDTDTRRIDLLCAAAAVIIFTDGSASAQHLVDEAHRLDEQIGSPRSRALLLAARSTVETISRRIGDRAAADAEEAFRLANELADPILVVLSVQALLRRRYASGDLSAVEELLEPLDQASRVSGLPFGRVRVVLCRTMNAIARGDLDRASDLLSESLALGTTLGTWTTALNHVQHVLLDLELGRWPEVERQARLAVDMSGPGVWNAVVALCGDEKEARSLLSVANEIPRNDHRLAFIALAAEVAARRSDRALGDWCAPQLEELGDATIVVGLGTVVLGFATHYAGLARLATGDRERASAHLLRASKLAGQVGAQLWQAWSQVELAALLLDEGRPDEACVHLDAVAASGVTAQGLRLRNRLEEVTAARPRDRTATPGSKR